MGYSIKDSPWFNFFYYTILFTYAYIQRNVCLHYTLLCTLTLLQLIINVVIPVPLSLVPSSDVDLPVKTWHHYQSTPPTWSNSKSCLLMPSLCNL